MGLIVGTIGVVQAQTQAVDGVGCISRLDSPLMLDGNLDEWQKVLPIFLGRKEHLPVLVFWPGPQAQPWQGPESASMIFYAAWTDGGLALAAQVTDRDLTKAIQDGKINSNVTMILSPSGISDFTATNAEKLQLTISPPVKGELEVSIQEKSESSSGMIEKKVRLTSEGYCFEVLIPWKVFSSFKPKAGASLSFQLSLKTHGGILLQRNASQDQPITHPQPMRFVLAEKNASSICQDLSLYSWINTSCPCCGDAMKIRFETFPIVTMLGTGVRIYVSAKDGKTLLEKRFAFSEFTSSGGQWVSPQVSLSNAKIPEDGCDITASVVNAKDEVVGIVRYSNAALPLIAKRLADTAVKKIYEADLPKLAQSEPFKAAAWMGVLSSVEWTRRSLELNHRLPDNSVLLGRAISELRARLAVLNGKEPVGKDAMTKLLQLTVNSDSQVLVEFERTRGLPDRKKGSVSIDWGSLPLMVAQVEEYSTAKEAVDSINKFRTPRTQKIVANGSDCYFTTLPYWQPAQFEAYDSAREFLLTLTPRKIGLTSLSALEENDVDVLAFFPSCPEKLKQNLTGWAAKAGKNVIPVSQADPTKRIAFVGMPDDSEMGKKLKQFIVYQFAISSQTGVLRFAKGTLTFAIPCLSLDSGKLFAEAILKGQAVSSEQADQIRQAVVRAIPRQARPLKLPKGLDLYVGDVHDHTIYSDGSVTPLGLIAEAFYTHLDFCAISDHHYFRNGAAPLKPMMEKMKLNYSMIPSVELTFEWGHFNVYPLKVNSESFADCSFNTVDQILGFAKKQGHAVVQWSHPGEWKYTTRDDRSFDPDSGIEAWEGYPELYDEWKKAGMLPVLTGGTDTHYGVFSIPIRTIILAESPSGDSLAGAIRHRNAARIDPYDGANYEVYWEERYYPRPNTGIDRYVYGEDRMIQLTVDALADGKYLKEQKKKQIQKALANFNPCAY
jgi:hypothetical protein